MSPVGVAEAMRSRTRRVEIGVLLGLMLSLSGCLTRIVIRSPDPVELPLMLNTSQQCYYIDAFLPLPNNILSGKAGLYAFRHYFYNNANYKEWVESPIALSFYSADAQCWSLYEEFTFRR